MTSYVAQESPYLKEMQYRFSKQVENCSEMIKN